MNDKLCLLLGALLLSNCYQAGNAQFYSRGSNSGTATVGGSAAFGGSLPFGGGTTPVYNPASGYASPAAVPAAPFVSPSGFYGPRPILPYPINAAEATMTPGFYHLGPFDYWRAPSGYYYPWGIGATIYGYPNQTYYLNQGQSQPVQQAPPLYSMFSDMQQYLDRSKKENRVSDVDYQHLFRRLQDLRGKYDHLIALNAALDPADEESLRKDAGMLGSEIATRIKPLAPGAAKSPDAPPVNKGPQNTHNKSGWVE